MKQRSKSRTGRQPALRGVYILPAGAPVSLGVMRMSAGQEGEQKNSRTPIPTLRTGNAPFLPTDKRAAPTAADVRYPEAEAAAGSAMCIMPAGETPGSSDAHSILQTPKSPVAPTRPRRRRGPYRRPQSQLKPTEVAEIEGAFREATRIGVPLNLAITINLLALKEAGSKTALANKAPNDALYQFRGNLRRFCRKHCVTHAAVWVREVDPVAGEHVHMAMHMPEALEPAFWKFIARYTGVDSSAVLAADKPEVLARSTDTSWLVKRVFCSAGWLKYMTKGIEGFHGTTVGKRAGCSRNIGKAAQRMQRRI